MNELCLVLEYPDWRPARRPLVIALLLSTVVVSIFLSLVPMPRWELPLAGWSAVVEPSIVRPAEVTLREAKRVRAETESQFDIQMMRCPRVWTGRFPRTRYQWRKSPHRQKGYETLLLHGQGPISVGRNPILRDSLLWREAWREACPISSGSGPATSSSSCRRHPGSSGPVGFSAPQARKNDYSLAPS